MGMADRIKERRTFMGLTQEELGEKLGLQKSAIAKYENGRVENIKRSVISNMAKVLDCSPAYLMGWEDKERPKEESSPQIMQYYEQLNDIGKHKAIERVKELTEVPRYVNAETAHYVNAAHPLDGASEEDKQFDEDMMDEENF